MLSKNVYFVYHNTIDRMPALACIIWHQCLAGVVFSRFWRRHEHGGNGTSQTRAATRCPAHPRPGGLWPAVREASPRRSSNVRRQSELLEGAAPEEILAWAVETYFPRFTWPPAWGPEGCVIISMLARSSRGCTSSTWTPAISFPKRWNCATRITDKYGITIDLQRPERRWPSTSGARAGRSTGPARPLLLRPQGGGAAPRVGRTSTPGPRASAATRGPPGPTRPLSAGITNSAW